MVATRVAPHRRAPRRVSMTQAEGATRTPGPVEAVRGVLAGNGTLSWLSPLRLRPAAAPPPPALRTRSRSPSPLPPPGRPLAASAAASAGRAAWWGGRPCQTPGLQGRRATEAGGLEEGLVRQAADGLPSGRAWPLKQRSSVCMGKGSSPRRRVAAGQKLSSAGQGAPCLARWKPSHPCGRNPPNPPTLQTHPPTQPPTQPPLPTPGSSRMLVAAGSGGEDHTGTIHRPSATWEGW